MEIQIRTTHLNRKSWAVEQAAKFEKKISHFSKVSFKIYKDESKWALDIKPQDRICICDERGQNYSSREFAKQIENMRVGGIQRMLVFVGGPFGLPEDLKQSAHLSVSLSSFVLNQEVAVVVMMEQLFRAFTIINNHPYHND